MTHDHVHVGRYGLIAHLAIDHKLHALRDRLEAASMTALAAEHTRAHDEAPLEQERRP